MMIALGSGSAIGWSLISKRLYNVTYSQFRLEYITSFYLGPIQRRKEYDMRVGPVFACHVTEDREFTTPSIFIVPAIQN
jgi:hypothetical protein